MTPIAALQLQTAQLPPEAETLRAEVRAFIAEERAAGRLTPPREMGMGFSPEMSARIAAKGWVAMTWPKRWGGHERSALERYVVMEELLAAAVPVGAHWVADRQSGPVLLRFGNDRQRALHLPAIARGERFFCIGMSEPDSGSDLASIRSRAERMDGGWRLNGHKLWTTNAHRAHFMISLFRTTSGLDSKHAGLSQFVIPLNSPGITVKPVISMAGEHDFNEVFFDDVRVDDDALVGEAGNGWSQVSAELAYERSGPERWLSAFRLLACVVEAMGADPDAATRQEMARLVSHLITLRQLSISVASMIQAGQSPNVPAAMVKDLGTRLEQETVLKARDIILRNGLDQTGAGALLGELLQSGLLWSPAFTIRGGTGEILRGVIAKGLGLR